MKTEQRLAEIFVELADTLVAEFDALDFLSTLTERSVELLGADAAGVILSDQHGRLQVVASTGNQAQLVEFFELQSEEGPCLECFTLGRPVANVDLVAAQARWPRFSAASLRLGYSSTHAVPLRLRDQVIGAMNLFCTDKRVLGRDDLALVQALADVATIGLLQERAAREAGLLAGQLQSALNSRILIEQAKGAVMATLAVSVDEAFRLMRDHSRRTGLPLRDVATSILDGTLAPEHLQP